MIHLNREAIQYAASMCRNQPRYKVYVAVTPRRKKAAFKMIIDVTKNEECEIKESINSMIVMYKNGSCIGVVPAAINSRGHRAHLLVVDDYVDPKIIDAVLRRIEILENVDGFGLAKRGDGQVAFKDEFIFYDRENNERNIEDVDETEFIKMIDKI